MRIFIVLLTWLLAALPQLSANAAEDVVGDPVALDRRIVLDDEYLRLGDLFPNIGDRSGTPVAYAPELGQRAVLDASWLAHVARIHEVPWQPTSRTERVVVVRDSRVIDRQSIVEALTSALLTHGLAGNPRVVLDGRHTSLHVPPQAAGDPLVDDLTFDPRSGRFSAMVSAPGAEPAPRLKVRGRAYERTRVPVLSHRVARDQIIRASDINHVELDARRLGSDTIVHADDLIGKSPRRLITAGMPVRTSDVRKPVAVKRNGLVTIILRSPVMVLTLRGQSMDEGAKGDVVRVRNLQSKKIIEGVVVGDDQVLIEEGAFVATN